jgi:hypothetical protein
MSALATLHLNGQSGHFPAIHRGDTYSESVGFYERNEDGTKGAAIDKSASTWSAQVRNSVDKLIVTFTVIAVTNQVTWSLTDTISAPLPPGTYIWDLQEDTGTETITWLGGKAIVERDATHV